MRSKNPRVVANALMLGFLLGFQHMYAFYPSRQIDSYKRGTFKEYQRFEQCIDLLQQSLSPALTHLLASKYYDEREQKSAENLIHDALEFVMKEVRQSPDIDMRIKCEVFEKIGSLKIVAGFPEELKSNKNMEEMYEELDLNGNENILETSIKIIKHNLKLDNEPPSKWTKKLNKLTRLNNLKYLSEEDVLYVPIEYTKYPYFSPNQPRLMNIATLFTEVVLGFNEGIKKHLNTKFNITYNPDYNSIDLGYKYYLEWIRANPDRKFENIPGFSLKNRQIYWVAVANTYYMKYHRSVSFFQLQALELQFQYYHVWFKARKNFRDAFNCSELNETEKEQFESFEETFNKAYKN
jgi:hypothetical protein